MFLTTKPQTIADFLQAINFIVPQGYDLKYFVAPSGTGYEAPKESNYTPQTADVVPGVTDTVLYTKKDLSNIHSVSASPINLNEIPNAMPRQQDIVTTSPLGGTGVVIQSPVKLDRRIGAGVQDAQLEESFMGFPKNTLFHMEEA